MTHEIWFTIYYSSYSYYMFIYFNAINSILSIFLGFFHWTIDEKYEQNVL